ncbi:PP2C family protein-serine/threonine phosphatase [Desulfatiferula olefinivorans]
MNFKTTESTLPEAVNARRRSNLTRYTFLAILSYQLPVGVAVMAKVFGIADYTYGSVFIGYGAYLASSLTALVMTRTRRTVTRGFITFVLYFQALLALIISGYLVYAMSNQRHLVPIGCLLILVFIFIQSRLLASMIAIAFTVLMYLLAAYLGMVLGGQPGSLTGEILYMLIFIPVCMFIAYMAGIMQDQQRKIKKANATLTATHAELETTHAELGAIHAELADHNERTMDSIRYAEMIQRSLLPGIDRIKAISPDSMFVWMPKDIVGGDIFYTYASPESSLIVLMDCTGHGVPGAFLTIIVYTEVRKIIMDEGCRIPSEILARLNRSVKAVLHRSDRGDGGDDGLDAAVVSIDHARHRVRFAGARMPLFYVKDHRIIRTDGDRHSIGYRDSDDQFTFTDHSIDDVPGCPFYLKSDGFTDQLGGPRGLRLGTRGFTDLVLAHHDKPFAEQRHLFIQTLCDHRGDQEQKDDITLIGFRLQAQD